MGLQTIRSLQRLLLISFGNILGRTASRQLRSLLGITLWLTEKARGLILVSGASRAHPQLYALINDVYMPEIHLPIGNLWYSKWYSVSSYRTKRWCANTITLFSYLLKITSDLVSYFQQVVALVVTDVRCKSSGRAAGSRVGLSGINIQLSLKKKHAKLKFTTKAVKN